MNPFQAHGIERLSYSSVEAYRADPAVWLLRNRMKVSSGTSAAMARGNAVEYGIELKLTDEFGTVSVEAAQEAACKKYRQETALVVGKEQREKELAVIPEYIAQGVEALSQFGRPLSTQNKLELRFDDIPVPFIGFDDFEFDGEPKLSIDLKTTGRCPSQIMDNHMRQGSLYQAMRPDHKIMFCYVTPKKHAIFEINKADTIEVVEEFRTAAKRMMTFLSLSEDPMELASIFAPNYSSFYWNDPILRAEAKRIFGV